MTFKLNGIDFMPYIAQDGIKWRKEDKEGDNAGDMQDGRHTRDKRGSKRAASVALMPLAQADAARLLAVLDNEYVYGDVSDPQLGERVNIEFMCYGYPDAVAVKDGDSHKWSGITFEIEER